MTSEVIEVPDLDLARRGANWPIGLEERVTAFLDQALPYQHMRGAFTRHNPEAGAALIKVIRKDDVDGEALRRLAELSADFNEAYDYAYSWERGSEVRYGRAVQLYAYYALGKLRATARTGLSTAELIELRAGGDDYFEKENLLVVSVEDGIVQEPARRVFGDFDHMGAVIVENDRYLVVVSYSGLSEEEDHLEARHTADYILIQLDKLDRLSAE